MAASPSENAQKLRTAMKGWGTDEAGLINVIANLGPKDIAPLVQSYSKDIGRDLVKDIKDETSGNFEDALLGKKNFPVIHSILGAPLTEAFSCPALLTPVIEYDAQLCRKAMKGIGTNEQILIEVICTRYPVEIKALCDEYKRVFARDLAEDVESETSGDFKKVLLHRLRAVEEKGDIDADVEHLYKAGQGKIGTDEAVFINILSHRSKDYIAKLNTAYSNKYNKSLAAVIDSEMSGDLKKAFIAIVTPPAEYFAELIHKAMKGMGTDDATLIRIIASQRFRTLKDMAAIYLNRHGTSLKKAVSDELSGDYKKLMVAVVEHIVENKVATV